MTSANIADIIDAIEQFAPLSLQETWDNSGLQVGSVRDVCSGVMLCVDVTDSVLDRAAALGCNLIVSHHPLLFRGLKEINPDREGIQAMVCRAIKRDITVYSSHTPLDKAAGGISYRLADIIGATVERPLAPTEPGAPTGLGVVARFQKALNTDEFVARLKDRFGLDAVKLSRCQRPIEKIAVCSGAGGEFLSDAIKESADAYITAEVRYHDFVDHGHEILIADIGHFESEECATDIFYEIISKKFHNFAIHKADRLQNPITYK